MIPRVVSGRPVTNRGAHLQPFGHHGAWCKDPDRRRYWLDLMQSMHLSWVVMLTDGDSCLAEFDGKPVVGHLLDAGIIPIIRYYAPLPRPFSGHDVVRRLVDVCKPYGIKPFVQLWNEPGDSREWVKGIVPGDWWQQFVNVWKKGAADVLALGALPGFPDGPGYDFWNQHPFRDTWDVREFWQEGAWYGVHNYGKGRPLDYPYENVSRFGTQLAEAEYRAALDDYADDPAWRDIPLDVINKARRDQANPYLTALDDDVCWNAWQKVDHYASITLGHSVPMAMTEGGWQPRDRAGSGPDCDLRWPLTTPRKVAEKTVAMFQSDAPLFAQCPWLLACGDMGGSGWEYDSWVTWAYADKYGREKPVVQALQQTPPQGRTLAQVMAELGEMVKELRLIVGS